MRLLSLYVTAFGGLRDFSFTFTEGLTELCLPNGAGKSTLAAFIKVMLFGFTKEGKTLEKNEERLYEPWQGGRFGGSLTLQSDGRTFRIERYFERVGKLKLREELTVIDEQSGLATDIFGEDIGRALFGVDGPSFMKTAYLSSRGITAGKTDDISAKLGGIEGEADDMAAFDRAVSLLKDKRREIRTQNTQKNGQKQLDLAERELGRVQEEILAAEAACERLSALSSDIEKKRADAASLDTTLRALREERSALDRRLGEREENRRRLDELRTRLAEEEAQEKELSSHFPNGVPTREQLDSLAKEAGEIERLGLAAAPRTRSATPLPEEGELAAMRSAVRYRDEMKTKLDEMAESEPHPLRDDGRTARLCLLLAAVLALLGGISAFVLLPLAIGLFTLGALLAVGGGLAYRRASFHSRAQAAHEAALANADGARRLAEEEAGDILVRFGLSRDAGMAEIDALYERALRIRMEEARAEEAATAKRELKERLEGALALYPTLVASESEARRIFALRDMAERLQLKRQSIASLKSEIVRLSATADKGEGEAPSKEAEEKLNALLGEAEATRAALTAALAEAGREESDCRALADTLPMLLEKEAACLATVSELTEKLFVLDKALECLLSARVSYEETYLGGVRGRIEAYTSRLLPDTVGEVRLDLELALSFLENGELHEAAYLSTGLLAILDVCLRLALTDALYPKDPPPLLLDDPFATLDEENLATALSLLRELGDTRQILYLTCHPSRRVQV